MRPPWMDNDVAFVATDCEECGKPGPWSEGAWGALCPACEYDARRDARCRADAETYGPAPYDERIGR